MKVAIIGAGNMGGAIARGLANGHYIQAQEISVSNPSAGKLDALKAEFPAIHVTHSNKEAAEDADIIIIAVKPWKVEEVLKPLRLRGDLVADEDHLLRGAAQDVGHECVEVGDARRHLHQKEDHVGLVDGQHHLPADVVFEDIVRIDRVSARVDHGKFLAVPIGFAVMAVARRAGRGVHDGLTLSHQTVEKGAFAHVGAADYRYQIHIFPD